MKEFDKPIVVVSKCLGFDHCRYNGLTISSHTVDKLKPYVEFKTVCPEVEIGLGVPRDPVRVIEVKDGLRLVQPSTGIDLTHKMTEFSRSFLNSLKEVDGFILKSRSPSCGIKDVKIYPDVGKVMASTKSNGFFGGSVLDKFPNLPVEDEGRLTNFKIREHFLTRLFTMARFRAVKSSNSTKELVKFHTENKLLLMAYNQEKMRVLGRLIANPAKRPLDELIKDYEENLIKAFSKIPRYTSNINVLMHSLGYFSEQLSSGEKAFFLESLERYKSEIIPLSVPLNIIRAFIVRFQEKYLMQQTFFEPYPEKLMEITDSGKGRDTDI